MNTKTNLLAALILLGSYTTVNAQVEVGARAGVNFSNIVWLDDNGDKVTGTNLTPGFHAGLTFDIPVARDFYVQPAALFNMKGSKLNKLEALDYFWDDEDSQNGDYTVLDAYYLEVPINLLFKPYMGNGSLLVGAGPYFAYGLGGSYNDNFGGSSNKGKLEFVNDWNQQSSDTKIMQYGKKVDAGLNLLLGYEFVNRFSVQLNGQTGLLNIEPDSDGRKSGRSMRNGQIGISVGYKF